MSGDPYNNRPWLSQYSEGVSDHVIAKFETIHAAFESAVRSKPNAAAIHYFGTTITYLDLDQASNGLAGALHETGFRAGDRLGLYLQNNPAFVIGMLAAWKIGGAVVALSPMNKSRELTYLLQDSGARAVVCLDELYEDVVKPVIDNRAVEIDLVVLVSMLDYQASNDPRRDSPAAECATASRTKRLQEVVSSKGRNSSFPLIHPRGHDLAILAYTSGTTGKPKGTMITHDNLRFAAQTYQEWIGLKSDDLILGIAPLFHVTGLVAHVSLSLIAACPLILTHRFSPEAMIETIREKRPTFTIGAITAFMSLMSVPGAQRSDFSSFKAVYSGGAPMPPAIIDAFEDFSGIYLHNAFGMTETCSPTHLVPLGKRAPIDEATGATSIGVPVFDTDVRIVDDEGRDVPVGESGEIIDHGPQVMNGYWQKPQATSETIRAGWLYTGDVGFMDAQGWFYLVDRKKDMIVVSGYKVWPREVEDVLYSHPAVREAVVVGIPDDYRGETVKAVVSMKPGAEVPAETLIEYCKQNLAAYKYPRVLEVLADLPKTASGKLMRSTLRDAKA